MLDDGKRADVKALCEELGADYVTRPTNLHAKAGNLNHALQMTDGEFVVIFDADHVAERHFIDRLVGYFDDENDWASCRRRTPSTTSTPSREC